MFERLEEIIGYKFKNKKLLEEALTHPSVSCHEKGQKKFNYERLEFLGDSLLACIIVDYLLKNYKNETEGQLSKRKAFLVSKQTISSIAKELNIGDFMILSRGEEQCGGRDKISNLENVLEAIIGAIFLDSNFIKTQKFVLNIWSKFNKWSGGVPIDPKTELQEWTQKNFKVLPSYKLLEAIGVELFTIELTVPNYDPIVMSGTSVKETEFNLARKMLDKISNQK